jgi:hypothetical protein
LEDFVAGTRHKTTRSARISAYFCYGLGVTFLVSAIAFHFDLNVWPLTTFIGASGVGFILGGIGYMRVAKRNSEDGAI